MLQSRNCCSKILTVSSKTPPEFPSGGIIIRFSLRLNSVLHKIIDNCILSTY
jgi:hypothetical protein